MGAFGRTCSKCFVVAWLLGSACTQENPAFNLGAGGASHDEGEGSTNGGSASTTTDTAMTHSGSGSMSSADGPESGSDGHETQGTGADESTTMQADETGEDLPYKPVFVTSQRFHPVDLGGLQGADAKCQHLAKQAGLPGTYQAWLSDATGSPATRMTRSGPYVLPNGQLVAENWDALVSGQLVHPIDVTETEVTVNPNEDWTICAGGEVWTNTTVDGKARAEDDCDNWSKSAGISFVGSVSHSNEQWSASDCINVTCVADLPLYCFAQ